MQVFKTFFKVMQKHLSVASIYIIVFALVGMTMAGMDHQQAVFADKKLDICVFDADGTAESRALCELIAKKHNIVTLENDSDVILDALYYERADYVLTVSKGYAEKLAAGETDGLLESRHLHESYATVYTEQLLNTYVGTVQAFLAAGEPFSEAAADAAVLLEQDAPVRTADVEQVHQSELSVAAYFRYLPYIIVCVLMNVLCPVLLAMTKKDIRFRTDCSGIRPARVTLQLFAGSTVFVLLIWGLLMIAGAVLNHSVYQGRAWIAVLNSFVFTLFSAAFALLVTSFSPPVNVINIITQIVSLGMCFLCGVFVDQSLLGDGVLSAARFLPAYWYIRVIRMLEGTEVYDAQFAAKAIAIEAAFTAVAALLTVMLRRAHVRSPKLPADGQCA